MHGTLAEQSVFWLVAGSNFGTWNEKSIYLNFFFLINFQELPQTELLLS